MSFYVLYTCRCGEVCSHIAALLFTVEAIFRHKVNDEHSCTDKPCEWNQAFSKKASSSMYLITKFFCFRFSHPKQ